MRNLLIITFLFFSHGQLFSQDVEEVEDTGEIVDVPFAVIENVPVYPGCIGEDNDVLRKCMANNVSAFVNKKFNLRKASKGLEPGNYEIFVFFKIDKEGYITNIRSRAPNEKIEKEAIKVIEKLPRMKPGEFKGKKVAVIYTLPITFNVE